MLPNGPRISCGDFAARAQTYGSFETEAPVSCMRLLGSTGLRNSPAFRFSSESLQLYN